MGDIREGFGSGVEYGQLILDIGTAHKVNVVRAQRQGWVVGTNEVGIGAEWHLHREGAKLGVQRVRRAIVKRRQCG